MICTFRRPDEMIAIGDTHTLRQDGRWRILTPRYRPGDTLRDHLDFALRHEAVDLAILNALFRTIPPDIIVEWIKAEPHRPARTARVVSVRVADGHKARSARCGQGPLYRRPR